MEIWKKIDRWEGRYEISNQGRVRRVRFVLHRKLGSVTYTADMPPKVMTLQINRLGYIRISTNYYGKPMKPLVHRLVAEAFIPSVDGKTCVNHINGVKDDNRVENLEWVTYRENNIHRSAMKKAKAKI